MLTKRIQHSFRKVKSAFLSDAPAAATVANLETSWDVRKTLANLRTRHYSFRDLPVFTIFISIAFCIFIGTYSVWLKLLYATVIVTLCSVPILQQFWLNFMPIATWLFLFFSSGYLDPNYRPKIFVRVLPALETILYGGNLSNVLSESTNDVLDILAWIPYGLVHFGAPFFVSALCFLFGPPKLMPAFAFAFGWMNYIGVCTQLLFPCGPPWYENAHGLEPANYTMSGSAGGLARIDGIIHINLYSGTFGGSPMVFGAFPSMHSGSAVIEALFMSYLFPRYTPLFSAYVCWIWWSTMYLTHHYFVDLTFGAVMALCMWYFVRMTILPRIQPGCFGRWSYEYVEFGLAAPSKYRKSVDDDLGDELGERLDAGFDAAGDMADPRYIELPVYHSNSAPVSKHASSQSIAGLGSAPLPSSSRPQSPFHHKASSSINLHIQSPSLDNKDYRKVLSGGLFTPQSPGAGPSSATEPDVVTKSPLPRVLSPLKKD